MSEGDTLSGFEVTLSSGRQQDEHHQAAFIESPIPMANKDSNLKTDPEEQTFIADTDSNGNDVLKRAGWTNKCESFLSTLGFAVGLGNVWRFPYVAYENGGGSFLIPYFVMVLLVGLPILFLEMSLGQYAQCGPTHLFGKLSPMFKGLGYSMLAVPFIIMIFYTMIIAWSVFYMFSVFHTELPWTRCETDACSSNQTSPEEDFFNNNLLGGYNSSNPNLWSELGSPHWPLVSCFLATWIIICLILIKGVKSSGKVAYVTTLFPYVVMVILFGVGLSLDGAIDGIKFYVTPNMTRIQEPEVWRAATEQIFFSLSCVMGGLINMASYNRPNHNCHRDAFLVVILNGLTSIFAGFVVFAILGYLANVMGKDVADVVAAGPSLAFIAYPTVVSQMPCPQLMAFLFFAMFLNLGLSSCVALVETVITMVVDTFKIKSEQRHWAVIGCCLLGFLLGLIQCTPNGIEILSLLDGSVFGWNLIALAVIEVTLVAWIYGVEDFLNNINAMGMKLPSALTWYWKICWQYFTPGALSILLVSMDLTYVGLLASTGLLLFIAEMLARSRHSNSIWLKRVHRLLQGLGLTLVGLAILWAIVESVIKPIMDSVTASGLTDEPLKDDILKALDINAGKPVGVQAFASMLALATVLIIPIMAMKVLIKRDPTALLPNTKWGKSNEMLMQRTLGS